MESMEGDFFTSAQSFFSSDSFIYLLYGLILYIALFWFALVIWVTKDIINRTNNILFQVFAILLVIGLNLPGLLIYLMLRPLQTLDDKYLDEIEMESFEKESKMCRECKSELHKEFEFCPFCGKEIQTKCSHCEKRSDQEFEFCPLCGKEKKSKKFHLKFDEKKANKKKKVKPKEKITKEKDKSKKGKGEDS